MDLHTRRDSSTSAATFFTPPPTEVEDIMLSPEEAQLIEKLEFEFDVFGDGDNDSSACPCRDDTCEWIMLNEIYQRWEGPRPSDRATDHSGILWIKGKLLSGKTTLLKYMANKLVSRDLTNTTLAISYFFRSKSEEEPQSTLDCYRSLLLQLFKDAPETQHALRQVGWMGSKAIMQQGWNLECLTQTLPRALSLLGPEKSLFLFIDGLDAAKWHEAQELVSFVEHLTDLHDSQSRLFRVCLSSRHFGSVTPRKGSQLTLEKLPQHEEAISRFIMRGLRLGGHNDVNYAYASGCAVEVIDQRMPVLLAEATDLDTELKKAVNVYSATSSDEDIMEMIFYLVGFDTGLRPVELFHAVRIGLMRWTLGRKVASGAMTEEQHNSTIEARTREALLRYRDYEFAFLSGEEEASRYIQLASKGLLEVCDGVVEIVHIHLHTIWHSQAESLNDLNCSLNEKAGMLEELCHYQLKFGGVFLEMMEEEGREKIKEGLTRRFPFLDYAVRNLFSHTERASKSDSNGALRMKTTLIKEGGFRVRGPYGYPILAAIAAKNVEVFLALMKVIGLDKSAMSKGRQHIKYQLDDFPEFGDFEEEGRGLITYLVQLGFIPLLKFYLRASKNHNEFRKALSAKELLLSPHGPQQLTAIWWARSEVVEKYLVAEIFPGGLLR
ncbi:hypothetical protein QBC35DRAFT_551684 [Podospora australis]|uniref:Nephrocystin 3-like N-terminal domain-containing protein n=1 Tax=Podospora australis TaxID=1536484 RepID=A0AAN6WUC9_9PEZI|nr:hypothetical protein QBC35DRAFT_551684 [Podospora australis]